MKKLWLILLAACLLGCVTQPETEPFPPRMQIQRHVPGAGEHDVDAGADAGGLAGLPDAVR